LAVQQRERQAQIRCDVQYKKSKQESPKVFKNETFTPVGRFILIMTRIKLGVLEEGQKKSRRK